MLAGPSTCLKNETILIVWRRASEKASGRIYTFNRPPYLRNEFHKREFLSIEPKQFHVTGFQVHDGCIYLIDDEFERTILSIYKAKSYLAYIKLSKTKQNAKFFDQVHLISQVHIQIICLFNFACHCTLLECMYQNDWTMKKACYLLWGSCISHSNIHNVNSHIKRICKKHY